MAKIREGIIKQLKKSKTNYDESSVNKLVKERYLSDLTLEEFMKKITPESQKWFEEFYNNFRPILNARGEIYSDKIGKNILLNVMRGNGPMRDKP